MKKHVMVLAIFASVCGAVRAQSGLKEGFTVDAASIGRPAADGVSGSITNTGGTTSSYRVRSMGGTWWMIQNANKYVSSGCTYSSIDMGSYGHLYSWNCAKKACPPGWSLPTDEDFEALHNWLSAHNKWSEWNSGSFLGLFGIEGSSGEFQGWDRGWWSSSSSGRGWTVDSGDTSGNFDTIDSRYSFSVRCKKSK
jgi:uncharacterized protein (TIGR02145 family)